MVATAVVVRRRAVLELAAVFSLTALAGCKIVPIDTEGQGGGFNGVAYAEKLWASQAVPHFQSAAKPVADVLSAIAADINAAGTTYGYRPATEGSPWTFVVSGSGKVTAKNSESRAGTLTIAIDGATPPVEVALQIGPVVRGNAVRDSLPFVSFKDFTNQLEFADVGKAFTAFSVAATADAAKGAKVGDTVTFTGVMSLNTKADRILVTPVALQVGQ